MSRPSGFDRAPPWWKFAAVAVMIVLTFGGSGMLVWNVQHELAVPLSGGIVALSMIGYFGYRFSRLRAEVASGKFSAQEYRNDPQRYIRGPTAPFVVWFVCTMVVAIGTLIILSILRF